MKLDGFGRNPPVNYLSISGFSPKSFEFNENMELTGMWGGSNGVESGL